MTGVWKRDLDTDIAAICTWGAKHLVTLLEPHEFVELGIEPLPERARAAGLRWYGLPITDGAAPDFRFLEPWKQWGPQFMQALQNGDRIVVHCKGGLGRAGLTGCLLLLDSGTVTSADQAMARTRAVRPGAIETLEQEIFLRAWRSST
ncbi:cyclin-dependent kinase inhibitor 3 family protein [Dyella sp.]|uniref:cyclin-dependent kinase inhibitor 3 family protein n=1 Tax=Dyella sp. TaxID=1869338 RepID=UPI002D7911D6|nr:cyclin-dependent kinase inhibitor 3 family protein [Dyella sp.]